MWTSIFHKMHIYIYHHLIDIGSSHVPFLHAEKWIIYVNINYWMLIILLKICPKAFKFYSDTLYYLTFF